MILYPER